MGMSPISAPLNSNKHANKLACPYIDVKKNI